MHILTASFAPRKNDCFRVYVPGKSQPVPKIIPAQLAITIDEISIVPCIQITRTDCHPKPLGKKYVLKASQHKAIAPHK